MLRRASRGIVRAGGLALLAMCFAAPSAFALGGPVILGGDDLTSHGGLDAMGNSHTGWLYMDKAIGNISPQVTKPNNGSIAAIGSADPGPLAPGDSGNAGKGIAHAAVVNGLTVRYADGDAAINQIFAEIANGSYAPRIIWISGDGATNDLGTCSSTETTALTANATVINNFVNAGGGLMSHESCYGWLSALLPGLSTIESGGSGDLVRTAEGAAAFPGVTDADFNAGPWHNYFQGDFGGLQALVVSNNKFDANGLNRRVVIGGASVSLTQRPADTQITKTASVPRAAAGSNVTYTLAVKNNGSGQADAVQVTDTLPGSLTFVSAAASAGSCSGTQAVTCNLGSLAVGATATVTIVARVRTAGTIANTAQVASNNPDPVAANNTSTATVGPAATAPTAPTARDSVRPRVAVAGVAGSSRGTCTARNFTARVTITERNLRSATVFVDGRRVGSTSRRVFNVRVMAQSLASRAHTLRIVALDRAGNRAVITRRFRRCARISVAPRFTG